MPVSATPLDTHTESALSVHAEERTCQWCGKHRAEIHNLDGAWCCELHREADRNGQPRPVWRPVPANAIHDGYGCCVWCAEKLGSPDCCQGDHPDAHSLSAQLAQLPIIVFGGPR
jgi:hypothetical protein